MMDYTHRMRLLRVPAGTPDGEYDDNDVWVPSPEAAPVIVFEGLVDLQDKGRVITRDEQGRPLVESDAVAFLEDEDSISSLQLDDLVTLTALRDGRVREARVVRVRELDGSVDLVRL